MVLYGIFFVGCQSIVLVGVSVVSDFVVMMEAGVVDCMMVLHPVLGLLVLCFDVVSYKFGVEYVIFFVFVPSVCCWFSCIEIVGCTVCIPCLGVIL